MVLPGALGMVITLRVIHYDPLFVVSCDHLVSTHIKAVWCPLYHYFGSICLESVNQHVTHHIVGATPAGWTVISIVSLEVHKRKGRGAKYVCSISRTEGELVTILFVNDTDVIHIDVNTQQSAIEVHRDLQASIASWSNLLMASGGTLKRIMCVYCLISFNWSANEK